MDHASVKREKSKSSLPDIPVESRVANSLEAINKCCIDNDVIEKEDERYLYIMLSAVFFHEWDRENCVELVMIIYVGAQSSIL